MFGAFGDFVEFFLADHVDRSFHQIAHHGFHIPADVSDFGVFRGFHFHEGAAGEPRQAARDFGLAHASGTNHQNIFGKNIFGKFGCEFLAAHPIAQSDRDRLLGEILADNIFVEFDHDFARGKLVKGRKRFRLGRARLAAGKIDDHFFLRFFGHSSSTVKLELV